VLEIEALLFQASGFRFDLQLIKDQDSKIHLHELHTAWRNLRERLGNAVPFPEGSLSSRDWVLSPTRPSNLPTVRIAVASELLARIAYRDFHTTLTGIVSNAGETEASSLQHLLEALEIDEDPFWSFHYSFAESSPRAHSLLGETRKHEIIINTILPYCSVHALMSGKEEIHQRAARIASQIPPVENNAITRKMEKQLIAGAIPLNSAAQQQGLMQLYERYCSEGRCSECKCGGVISSP